jgi:hypothetical protein
LQLIRKNQPIGTTQERIGNHIGFSLGEIKHQHSHFTKEHRIGPNGDIARLGPVLRSSHKS